MVKETYDITGMTCSACSSRVEKSVAKLEGIDSVSVNLLTNSMRVTYQEELLDGGRIMQAVESAGYGAALQGGHQENTGEGKHTANTRRNHAQAEITAMKQRLIISFCFLIPLMYVAMHHMFWEWFGIPVPDFMKAYFHGDENAVTFAFVQFLLVLPIMYVNRKYFITGFRNLFHASPNMDSLIAMGAMAAVVYGCFAIVRMSYGLGHQDRELVARYSMDLYFESAGTILALITFGKYLESRSKGKTSEALEKLMNLAPKMALVERSGEEVTIPVEQVEKDEIVIIKPGASVPVDGIIIEGSSSIDESAITGESIPVEKTIGDTAVSATLNKNGYLKLKASKVGEDTTIAQIIRLVEEASSSKAPIAKLADKIAGVFVPIVIVIAFLAAIVWLLTGASFEFALSIGISVLVISCPCALGLATPVAIMVGTGKGAENGILIKSGEALEIAHKVDTVVMDKTGTITEGNPVVTNIMTWELTEKELLLIAASLEKKSEHPLAEAVLQKAEKEKLELYEVLDFEVLQGQGVAGRIREKQYYAGNTKLLQEKRIPVEGIQKELDRISDEGQTPLLFADKQKVLGIIAVRDVEKQNSKYAIEQLRKMKIDVVMLTGDNERVARAMQKRMQIPHVIAGVLPQDKERHIRELQEKGHIVAMIGDGINDAPALARADVGIAIGAGTEVAIESADAVLIKNDLLDAVTAIKLSKAVIRNIKENLFWAFIYNSIGIPLAAGVFYQALGWKLNPMFGAAAMSLSSVCVVGNALRLKLFKPVRLVERPVQNSADGETNHTVSKERKEEKGMFKAELEIEGMMCAHCKKHVEEALGKLEGTVEVDLEKGKAYVETKEELTDEVFQSVIREAGYEVKAVHR